MSVDIRCQAISSCVGSSTTWRETWLSSRKNWVLDTRFWLRQLPLATVRRAGQKHKDRPLEGNLRYSGKEDGDLLNQKDRLCKALFDLSLQFKHLLHVQLSSPSTLEDKSQVKLPKSLFPHSTRTSYIGQPSGSISKYLLTQRPSLQRQKSSLTSGMH